MSDQEIVKMLPAFFRTLRGQKPIETACRIDAYKGNLVLHVGPLLLEELVRAAVQERGGTADTLINLWVQEKLPPLAYNHDMIM